VRGDPPFFIPRARHFISYQFDSFVVGPLVVTLVTASSRVRDDRAVLPVALVRNALG